MNRVNSFLYHLICIYLDNWTILKKNLNYFKAPRKQPLEKEFVTKYIRDENKGCARKEVKQCNVTDRRYIYWTVFW